MENKFLLTDEMLWDYADGFLSPAEKGQVEDYLRGNPEWKARLDMIQAEKRELFSMTLEAPNPGFADRVMAAWAAEQRAPAVCDGLCDRWLDALRARSLRAIDHAVRSERCRSRRCLLPSWAR